MKDLELIIILPLALIALIVTIVLILRRILKNPFEYPYFDHYFDVSGKKLPKTEDYIDDFLNYGGFNKIEYHQAKIQKWKDECAESIQNSRLKGRRQKQYERCVDDSQAYRFRMVRNQTRYRQINYVKMPYTVQQEVEWQYVDYKYLARRERVLQAIGYECTINEYLTKEQRRLMTKELRREIMIRDNYTCQICGKYMPDGVGLQIDHKIPVSKGGKTVRSNLQVLCSKCNGGKSNKV